MERAQISVLVVVLIIFVSLIGVLIVSSFLIPIILKEMKEANRNALELSLSKLQVEKEAEDLFSINLSVTAANTKNKIEAIVFRFFDSEILVCIKNQLVDPPMSAMETRTFQIVISDCPSFERVVAEGIYQDESCKPLWNCSDWGECGLIYSFKDIAEGILLGKKGERERWCSDLNGCIPRFNDVQVCEIDTAITATKVEKCGKEFIEINSSEGGLISRLEYLEGRYKRLNIQFTLGDDSCPEF